MDEKRAEPARLELALESAPAELRGCRVVDRGGLECLTNLAERDTQESIERFALVLRGCGHVALACDLRVAQCRRRSEVVLDKVAVLSDEPVGGAGRRSRFA